MLVVRTVTSSLGLFFARATIFLLFLEIFAVERGMRIAIWAGVIAALLWTLTSVPVQAWFLSPRPGETWYDVAMRRGGGRGMPWYVRE